MSKLFFEYLDYLLIVYVDNIIVYSKTENDHLAHLRKVFKKFHYAGLKLKPACYALVILVCIGLLVKVLRILLTSW